jgi:hypothetical protein
VLQVHLFFTQVYVNKSCCRGGGGELESQWIWQQLAREQRFDLKVPLREKTQQVKHQKHAMCDKKNR